MLFRQSAHCLFSGKSATRLNICISTCSFGALSNAAEEGSGGTGGGASADRVRLISDVGSPSSFAKVIDLDILSLTDRLPLETDSVKPAD